MKNWIVLLFLLAFGSLLTHAQDDTPTLNGLIEFQSVRDGNYEIYTIRADGCDQTRLTTDRDGDYWPSWGPSLSE